MNVPQARQFVLASSPTGLPDQADVRLAAYIAAMDQNQIPYNLVLMNDWWNARCQLGLLVGKECERIGFGVLVPCGKSGNPKTADADEFCHLRYRPHPRRVRSARRRLCILRASECSSLDELKDNLEDERTRSL